jgi:hypothetical protein
MIRLHQSLTACFPGVSNGHAYAAARRFAQPRIGKMVFASPTQKRQDHANV